MLIDNLFCTLSTAVTYIYIYTHTHDIHTRIRTYTHIYVYMYLFKSFYLHMYIIFTYVYVYICISILCACVCTYIDRYIGSEGLGGLGAGAEGGWERLRLRDGQFQALGVPTMESLLPSQGLQCSSFLGSILYSLSRKQVITKKELHESLWVHSKLYGL